VIAYGLLTLLKPKPAPAASSSKAPSTPTPAVASTPVPPAAPVQSSAPLPAAIPATPTPAGPGVPAGVGSGGLSMGAERAAQIAEMEAMGFERTQIEAAMRAAFYNSERAIEYLLNVSLIWSFLSLWC